MAQIIQADLAKIGVMFNIELRCVAWELLDRQPVTLGTPEGRR